MVMNMSGGLMGVGWFDSTLTFYCLIDNFIANNGAQKGHRSLRIWG